jgi:hypothetical protein
MSNLHKRIEELTQKVRANRATPEMTLVAQWLEALETDAVEMLVGCTVQDHDACAARVRLLRMLRKKITEPSFAERQAKYVGVES